MRYLARLVEQSGLTIEGQTPRIMPTEGQAPDRQLDGIEEIDLEVPAPPLSARDVTQAVTTPDPPREVASDEIVPPEVPDVPVVPAPVADRAPEKIPDVSSEEPPHVVGTQTKEPHTEPSELQTSEAAGAEIRITRQEVLRHVYEWVATNDPGAKAPPDPQQPRPPEAAIDAPDSEPPEPTPGAEVANISPARRIGTRKSKEPEDPPPSLVEISEPSARADPPEALRPESREERIDISIGAINLTLEAPPQPQTKDPPTPPSAEQVQPLPRAWPRRAPAPSTADRLRRRFIRI